MTILRVLRYFETLTSGCQEPSRKSDTVQILPVWSPLTPTTITGGSRCPFPRSGSNLLPFDSTETEGETVRVDGNPVGMTFGIRVRPVRPFVSGPKIWVVRPTFNPDPYTLVEVPDQKIPYPFTFHLEFHLVCYFSNQSPLSCPFYVRRKRFRI